MKAFVQNSYGGNDVLTIKTLPKPEIKKPRDILVKIQAVATNPIDYKVRNGFVQGLIPFRNDIILGWDASGVVESVGAEVQYYKPGDAVYFAGDISRDGTFAEYTLVDERIVGRKPNNLSFEDSAALPLTALTAFEGLVEKFLIPIPKTKEEEERNASKTILVVGGAGGVGAITTQIAKRILKLRTIAAASRPATQSFAKDMGADYVIDHTKDYKDQLQALGIDAVDYVFNTSDTTLQAIEAVLPVLRPFGRYLAITASPQPIPAAKLWLHSISFDSVLMFTKSLVGQLMDSQRESLNRVAEWTEAGLLKPHVGLKFDSLKDLPKALEVQESGKAIGKIVLKATF